MLKRWWELWRGRLESELSALEAAGVHYEYDQNALKREKIVLRLEITLDGKPSRLEAHFPDVYPYTRFELIAPDLNLCHHQNPILKNLCLIGRASPNWRVTDTLADFVINRLPLATALRASEILALRWSDLLWNEGRIRISKRWAEGRDGATKTEASDGYVPLHPILTAHLRAWREQSPHTRDGDFVFPSLRACGRVPLSASIFVADHLRPAAKKAGVPIEDGQRFGLHNLRHSLSNWLVNKAKVEPKTVQGILRHAKIQTTLDLYTQEDCDETLAAQGEYLTALGVGTQMV